MYPGIELRLLRYVVGLAEELHFGRAARKLHVSQPALSKQLRDVENEVGTKLFERNNRHVRLTDAGQAFVEAARDALFHSNRAVHAAKTAQQPKRLLVGYCPYANLGLISAIRSVSSSQFPGMTLLLTSVFTVEQIQLIRTGELDAGLVTLPISDSSVTAEPILTEPLLVAIPESHRLVRGKLLRLRDLRNVPVISLLKRLHPDLQERLRTACIRQGFEPLIVQDVTTFAEAMAMVAEGVGITFAPQYYSRFRCAGAVFRRLEGNPLAIESGFAFRAEARSTVLPALTSALRARKIVARHAELSKALGVAA